MGGGSANNGPDGTGPLSPDDTSDRQKAEAVRDKQTRAAPKARQAARQEEGVQRKNLLQAENISEAGKEEQARARRSNSTELRGHPENGTNLLGGGGTSLLGYN